VAYFALCLIFLLLRFNRLILFFFHFPLIAAATLSTQQQTVMQGMHGMQGGMQGKDGVGMQGKEGMQCGLGPCCTGGMHQGMKGTCSHGKMTSSCSSCMITKHHPCVMALAAVSVASQECATFAEMNPKLNCARDCRALSLMAHTTMELLLCMHPMSREMCSLTARMCDQISSLCGSHSDNTHCQECAAACMRAATECRNMTSYTGRV